MQDYSHRIVLVGLKIFVLCFALLALSCGKQSSQIHSDLLHDIDQPVRSDNLWNWYQIESEHDKDIFFQQVVFAGRSTNLKYLNDQHKLSRGLASLVDDLDSSIRASFSETQKQIPKPKVLVKVEERPNAAVVQVPVCYEGTKFSLLGQKVEPTKPAQRISLSWDGVFQNFANLDCKRLSLDSEIQRASFVSWVNTNLASCRAAINGEKIEFSESCGFDADVPVEFSTLALYVTGPAIVISSALVNSFDRPQLLSILAHELGHYYRSHATSALEGGGYNFFYQLPEMANDAHKPIPNPDLTEFGNKVRKIRVPNKLFRRVKGQVWDSEFYRPLQQIISTVDAEQDCSQAKTCNQACDAAAVWMHSSGNANALDGFPYRQLTDAQVPIYLEFEKIADACIKDLNISENSVSDGSAISRASFVAALSQDLSLYLAVFTALNPSGTVLESLRVAKAKLENFLTDLYKPLQEARDQRLGYYTVEQEADELSLEWTTEMGILGSHALVAELSLAAMREARDLSEGVGFFPHYVPKSRCEELSKNNWHDESGNPVFIPIVDYVDSHHSSCFRAYNLDREIKAHAYEFDLAKEQAALSALAVDEAAYAKLRSEAEFIKQNPDDPRINDFKSPRGEKIPTSSTKKDCVFL